MFPIVGRILSTALDEPHHSVDAAAGKRLCCSVWPPDSEAVDARRVAEAKMQPQVILREKARLTDDGVRLPASGSGNDNRGADRAPVGFGPLQLHRDPVIGTGEIIPQKRWWLTHVHHQHVDVPVVVEVAERRAATRASFSNRWTGTFADVFEATGTEIAEDEARAAIAHLSQPGLSPI